MALVTATPAIELPVILRNNQKSFRNLLACEVGDILGCAEQGWHVHVGAFHDLADVQLLDGEDAVEGDVRLDHRDRVSETSYRICCLIPNAHQAWGRRR